MIYLMHLYEQNLGLNNLKVVDMPLKQPTDRAKSSWFLSISLTSKNPRFLFGAKIFFNLIFIVWLIDIFASFASIKSISLHNFVSILKKSIFALYISKYYKIQQINIYRIL